jgi:hypothetical protein
MISFEGIYEIGSELPMSPVLLLCGEGKEALVICTGKLVVVWFVWNGKEEEGEEEEEKGVVAAVVVLVALL